MTVHVEDSYRQHGPMVLRRCRRILGNEEEAVEAMQDTFVRLLEKQHTLSADHLTGLLYRMATNVCLNRLRTRRRRPADADTERVQQIADARLPEDRLLSMFTLGRLFSRHRESTRTIAVLHLLDGMTLEEVAREVGMSVSGVRKRLAPLRQELEKLDTGESKI